MTAEKTDSGGLLPGATIFLGSFLTFGVQMFLLAAGALLLAGGCRPAKTPPRPADAAMLRRACCVFLRQGDSRVLGGGVFVGFPGATGKRVFCLTARHVVTEWDDGNVRRAHYRHPQGLRIAVASGEGVRVWEADIAPDRWMTVDKRHDLAWFELTAEEQAAAGDISVVPVGATVEAGMHPGGGVIEGVATVRQGEYAKVGITCGSDLLVFRPVRLVGTDGAETEIGTGAVTNVATALKSAELEPIEVDFARQFKLRHFEFDLLVTELATRGGDSGAPVFAMGVVGMTRYPLLLGVVTASNPDFDRYGAAATAISPTDAAFPLLGAISAHRIVDCTDYQ